MLVHRVTEELLQVLDAVIDARVLVLGGLAALGMLVVRVPERLQFPRVLLLAAESTLRCAAISSCACLSAESLSFRSR